MQRLSNTLRTYLRISDQAHRKNHHYDCYYCYYVQTFNALKFDVYQILRSDKTLGIEAIL